ncbi:tetratricopeptide repeat protein, partial [Persephonella sp.]
MEEILRLIEKGNIPQAFKKAESSPYPESILYKAVIHFHTGNNIKAKELLKKFINLDKNNPESYYYLGSIYL